MPRLPKGMYQKGGAYYTRKWLGGKDRWIALGREYVDACRSLRELRAGDRQIPSQATVAAVASRWLEMYVATARTPANQKKAHARVRKYLDPHLGVKPVARVTKDDLRTYRIWLEGRGISVQTVKHILADARCMFRWAEDSGYVERSPFPRRLMPKLQERPPDRLWDEEVAKLTCLPDPHGFIIRLALGTGLRWGEIVRARTSDIQDGMLLVSRTKSRRVRRVPLPPDLLGELRSRIGLLSPLHDPWTFNQQVRRISGIERFQVHQTRHTFACLWLERGGSLAALQEILGHASVVTTQRYARLTEAHVKAEAARIAGRFVEDSEKAV